MTPPTNDREDRLNAVLLAYVEACETGAEPDRAEVLAAHPDLGEELTEFFAGRDEIEELAGLERDRRGPNSGAPPGEVTELGQLGDFRLIREIGRGGMGVVYEAEQLSLRRRVALKVLPFAAAVDPRRLRRFQNEAAAAAHLRHENVVPVYAVGSERGVHYYAMQFVEGQSLAALLSELRSADATPAGPAASTAAVARLSTERRAGGPAYFDWVAGLGRQAALALDHAHQTGVELADRPGMELLRKRVLRTALGYYQEFAAERGNDPGARAELLDTTRRVEQILADLAVLRSATHFYLLCQPVVLDDLDLDPGRRPRLKQLTDRVGREWAESFRDIGLVPPAERGRRTLARARANEAELNAVLTPAQQLRLRQIGLQSEGPGAFRDPEVAAVLALTPGQRDRVRVIEDDAAFGWLRARSGGREPAAARSTNDRLLAVLTPEQAGKWRALVGEPVRGAITPFGNPPAPKAQSKTGSPP